MRPVILQGFAELCNRMKQSKDFELEIRRLWHNIQNKPLCAQILLQSRCGLNLSRDEAVTMSNWLYAFFSKTTARKTVTAEERLALWTQQKGICPSCGKPINPYTEESHADHIIPFTYVGDELPSNLQLLHRFCNLSKGKQLLYCIPDSETPIQERRN